MMTKNLFVRDIQNIRDLLLTMKNRVTFNIYAGREELLSELAKAKKMISELEEVVKYSKQDGFNQESEN